MIVKKIRQICSTELFLLKMAFCADKKSTVLFIFSTLLQHIIPLIAVWLWARIIDRFAMIYTEGRISSIVLLYLGAYLILQLLVAILRSFGDFLFHRVKNQTMYLLDKSIMQKTTEVDAGFFDDPANRDALTAAKESGIYISGNVTTTIYYIVQLVTLIWALVMFLTHQWLVGLVYIFTYIPGVILSFNQKEKIDEFSMRKIPYEREKNYYKSILTSEHFAKELRLYQLADRFKEKYNELWNKIRKERTKLFYRGSAFSLLSIFLTYVGLVFVIIFSVRSVIMKTMTIGTLVLFIGLAGEAGDKLNETLEGASFLSEIVNARVEKFKAFLNYENQVKYGNGRLVRSCPTIEFKNVSFKYPGNDQYTIHNLNLIIESGKKIALVGINGAGKTTIVKLLLRFYEPEVGQILLDGMDIHFYSREDLNRIFGVCFQNVSKYSLTLKENLSLSDISRSDDAEALLFAAISTGADEIIKQLPQGLDSDMTRDFNDEGVELSGGQWQKIALSRTFFRNAGIIILDEPSSALDPEAEDRIFSSFKKICEDRSGILISHRLSSVMLVDKIAVIENGTVIESGTHDELMEKDGRYAELYRTQSERYMKENFR